MVASKYLHRPEGRRILWIALGIMAAWIVVSLAWSLYLSYVGFQEDWRNAARDNTAALATSLEARPAPTVDRYGSYLTWAYQQAGFLNRRGLNQQHVGYVLVWNKSGVVALLAQARAHGALRLGKSTIDGSLPAARWPALAPGQRARIRQVSELPWQKADTSQYLNVTVRLRFRHGAVDYLSVGYWRGGLAQAFWSRRWNLVRQAGLFTAGGAAIIVAAMVVAARQFEENRRRQEQASLARTSLLTERGMLASVLAHEVRSPLTALQFNLHTLRSLLERQPGGAARPVELANSCEREIRRLDLMLNDFLQRTQVVSPAGSASANAVVREALDFVRPAMERKNIRIVTHLDAADPKVNINADELRQVVLNLSANAQDAMPRGGTLVVSTVSEAQEVTLLVRDSGTGIPLEAQKRLFEPFFTTKPQGSGLGLALVRRVVSGAGGKVFCESKPGDGATFRLVFPRGDPGAPVAREVLSLPVWEPLPAPEEPVFHDAALPTTEDT